MLGRAAPRSARAGMTSYEAARAHRLAVEAAIAAVQAEVDRRIAAGELTAAQVVEARRARRRVPPRRPPGAG